MKKVLLLTYNFPPEINGGVDRPYSLYKYLPDDGYEVTVITTGRSDDVVVSNNIYHVPSVKHWSQGKFLSVSTASWILSELISRLFLCPFADIYWWFRAKKYFLEECCASNFDLIYASFPPIDTIFLACSLQKKTGTPLVIEFRDGLGCEPLLKNISARPLVRLFNRFVERRVVSNASLLVTIGRNMADYYKQAYPNLNVATVYNGFLPDIADRLRSPSTINVIEKTRIAHFGSIGMSRRRSVVPLFKAVHELKREGKINQKNFILTFWGRFTKEEIKLVDDYDIGDVVSFREQVNKVSGLQEIMNDFSHVLLYGAAGDKTVVTSKIFDYLLVNKPILGICSGNEVEALIRESGLGDVCGFVVEEIKALFLSAIDGKTPFAPDHEYIEKFNRKNQAHEIAMLLNQVILREQGSI